jgi:hypothetical protein
LWIEKPSLNNGGLLLFKTKTCSVMNAMEILRIGKEYQSGKLSLAEASLALVKEGYNAEEVERVLDNYTPIKRIADKEDRIK